MVERRVRPSKKVGEALAYLCGFTVVAVPGTFFFLGSEVPVSDWKPIALIILEFASAQAMRSGFLRFYVRGQFDERN